jgi:hypothetical protein
MTVRHLREAPFKLGFQRSRHTIVFRKYHGASEGNFSRR